MQPITASAIFLGFVLDHARTLCANELSSKASGAVIPRPKFWVIVVVQSGGDCICTDVCDYVMILALLSGSVCVVLCVAQASRRTPGRRAALSPLNCALPSMRSLVGELNMPLLPTNAESPASRTHTNYTSVPQLNERHCRAIDGLHKYIHRCPDKVRVVR